MSKISKSGTDAHGVPYLVITDTGNYSVFKTFDCGQCFRFDKTDDERHKYAVSGVAYGKYIVIAEDEPGTVTLYGITEDEYASVFCHFLALDTDYGEIDREIASALPENSAGRSHMEACIRSSEGIRILAQEPWEALCSFIVSQNNNIPRIKKIIRAMCEAYGEKIITPDGRTEYAFPTADSLAAAGVDEIFALRTGFRAKYIYDCAVKYKDGMIDTAKILASSDYEECEKILESISGVGPKVAACALLFGFGKTDAFPIDVWIKKVIAAHFPDGLDYHVFGRYAGIAQQYMFYHERYIASGK